MMMSSRWICLGLCLAGAMGVGAMVGCGSDGVTPSPAPQGSAPLQTPGNPTPRTSATNTPAAVPVKANGVTLDAWATAAPGARWTLFVMRFSSPGHVQESVQFKKRLIEQTGRTEWVVVHEESQSVLYFGAYKEVDASADPVDGKRFQQDLSWFHEMKDASTQRRVFSGVMAQPIPLPDPPAPAEWNLATIDRDKDPNDPNRRYWSLVVAGYNLPGEHGESRKQLAVDVVRAMREQGHIEAYFYHGPSVSHICIGAWKRSALEEQDSDRAQARKSDKAMVVSPAPLNDRLINQFENDGNTEVRAPNVVVLDSTLRATMHDDRFATYNLNGVPVVNNMTDPRTGQHQNRAQPSFLVEIPTIQRSIISGSAPAAGSENTTLPPSLLGPAQPQQGGQLRRLGN